MLFLAAATPGVFQRWLHDFVPFDRLNALTSDLRPEAVAVAALFLILGLGSRCSQEPPLKPLLITAALAACIGCSNALLSLVESGVAALVGDIVRLEPSVGWIVVNNPVDMAMGMNFDVPYQKIAAFVKGSFVNQDTGSIFNPGATLNYAIRCACIFFASFAATAAVLFMETLLVFQKLLVLCIRLLMPPFLGCLLFPATHGTARHFFKTVVAVLCWPLTWALVHIGTMAGLAHLTPPVWNSDPINLLVPVLGFFVVCVLMIVGTLTGPVYGTRMITRGENMAAGVLGAWASSLGQHAGNALNAASRVGGAVAGGAIAGQAGLAAGEQAGQGVGALLGAPVRAATGAVESVSEARHPVPSSASRAGADAALAALYANKGKL